MMILEAYSFVVLSQVVPHSLQLLSRLRNRQRGGDRGKDSRVLSPRDRAADEPEAVAEVPERRRETNPP
jgi:hypothetical protein